MQTIPFLALNLIKFIIGYKDIALRSVEVSCIYIFESVINALYFNDKFSMNYVQYLGIYDLYFLVGWSFLKSKHNLKLS